MLDDRSTPELGYSTIAFRKAVIDEHPQAIGGFLAALEEAVTRINADPEKLEGGLDRQHTPGAANWIDRDQPLDRLLTAVKLGPQLRT